MKQRIFALCVILSALGLAAATAEDSVTPATVAAGISSPDELLSAASRSCAEDSLASSLPAGLPDWLDASGCCPRTCSVNSDCDPVCGPGAGECKKPG